MWFLSCIDYLNHFIAGRVIVDPCYSRTSFKNVAQSLNTDMLLSRYSCKTSSYFLQNDKRIGDLLNGTRYQCDRDEKEL